MAISLIGGQAAAQEAATGELDACVMQKQLLYSGGGMIAGAVAGAGIAYLTRQNVVQGAKIGAGVGSLFGAGYAYFKAYGKCMQEHPEWKSESRLSRTKTFKTLKNRFSRELTKGKDIIRIEKLSGSRTSVALGSSNHVTARIIVMTQDGAEKEITLTNRLFIIKKDEKTGATIMNNHVFHGAEQEKRVVENGEFVYRNEIPLPPMDEHMAEMIGKTLYYELDVMIGEKSMDRRSFEFRITGNANGRKHIRAIHS
ncbi:MAG: hypothetical protein NC112_06540 [Oxalobacter formigenes]|nr:hypothetical protein [Oxalobacter formigenes]